MNTADPRNPESLPADAFALEQRDAARLVGLSAKTLERLAAAGEPVGRLKIGRRVLYHVATLEKWIRSRVEGATK